MRRAALLHCADVSPSRFKVLKQRDQLPFHSPDHDGPGAWMEYSIEDAFRLRVMLDLMDDANAENYPTGLGPQFAAMASQHINRTSLDDAESADQAIWVGVICFKAIKSDGTQEQWNLPFCQPLSTLDAVISAERSEWADAYSDIFPVRMFLTNASRAARLVKQKADELGVV